MDIVHIGQITLADEKALPDTNFDVQMMMPEQNRIRRFRLTAVSGKTLALAQGCLRSVTHDHHEFSGTNFVFHRITVAPDSQRNSAIEKLSCILDHFRTTNRIVAAGFLAAVHLQNYICAIQCVIQTVPARVGSIQCVTRIVHRYNQLRTGNRGYFVIHVVSGNLEIFTIR